jgi:hypothetical protein
MHGHGAFMILDRRTSINRPSRRLTGPWLPLAG